MDITKYINIFTEITGFYGRYFVIAGVFYFIFYNYKKNKFKDKKLQAEFPANSHIAREILFSVITLAIYCAISYLVLIAFSSGLTSIYLHISDLGWAYFFCSILIMIILHDTYFYWTHRLLHLPWMYKQVHHLHHKSFNPTPWAAFAFHPIEAFISALYLPFFILFIPLHPFAIIIFLFYMTLINVMGHSGFEWFSEKFRKSKSGQMQNTSTAHNIHHAIGQYNYGLYFKFWDKLMRTDKEK